MELRLTPNGILKQPQWAAENLTFPKTLLGLAKKLLASGEAFRPPALQPMNVTIQLNSGTDQIVAQHYSYPCVGSEAGQGKSPFIRTYSGTRTCAYGPMYGLAQGAFDKLAKGLGVDEDKPQAVLEGRTGTVFIGHNFESIKDCSTRSRIYHFVLEYFYQRSTEQRNHGEAVARSFKNVLGAGFFEPNIIKILEVLSPVDRVNFAVGLGKAADLAFMKQCLSPELLDELFTGRRFQDFGAALRRLDTVTPAYAKEIRGYLAAGSMPSGGAARPAEIQAIEWDGMEAPKRVGDRSARELWQLRRTEPQPDPDKRLQCSMPDLIADDIQRQTLRFKGIYSQADFILHVLENMPVTIPGTLSNLKVSPRITDRNYVQLQTRVMMPTPSGDDQEIRLRWHTKIADTEPWVPGYRVETGNLTHEMLFLRDDSPILDTVIQRALGMLPFHGELHKKILNKGLQAFWAERDQHLLDDGTLGSRLRKLSDVAPTFTLSTGEVWNSADLDTMIGKSSHFDFAPEGMERFLEEIYGKLIAPRNSLAEAV